MESSLRIARSGRALRVQTSVSKSLLMVQTRQHPESHNGKARRARPPSKRWASTPPSSPHLVQLPTALSTDHSAIRFWRNRSWRRTTLRRHRSSAPSLRSASSHPTKPYYLKFKILQFDRKQQTRHHPRRPNYHSSRPSCSFSPLQEVMVDPVMCADGHTYERHAIERWLQEHQTSPKTNAMLPNASVGRGSATFTRQISGRFQRHPSVSATIRP